MSDHFFRFMNMLKFYNKEIKEYDVFYIVNSREKEAEIMRELLNLIHDNNWSSQSCEEGKKIRDILDSVEDRAKQFLDENKNDKNYFNFNQRLGCNLLNYSDPKVLRDMMNSLHKFEFLSEDYLNILSECKITLRSLMIELKPRHRREYYDDQYL